MKPVPRPPEGAQQRLSLEDVEDEALETLFQQGVQARRYFAPLILLAVMSLLAGLGRPLRAGWRAPSS